MLTGWNIVLGRLELPADIANRYSWMPAEYREFAISVISAVAPGEKAWILTAADFRGQSASAFAWNECDWLSLDAVPGDAERIRCFWDEHLPILMSVKDGYAYLAIEKGSLAVVAGDEPEFEETTPVCASFGELLAMIERGECARWM